MVEGEQAVKLSQVFWAAIRRHGGGVTGDWWLESNVYGDGVPVKKINKFSAAAGIGDSEGGKTLLYYDGTVFGSGKKGLLLTDRKMYVYYPSDGKIWNISNAQAKVSLDLSSNKLVMNDKHTELTFPSLSLARSVRSYLEYLQNPISMDPDVAAQRIWNPAAGSPLLTALKQLGVKDESVSVSRRDWKARNASKPWRRGFSDGELDHERRCWPREARSVDGVDCGAGTSLHCRSRAFFN